MKKKITWIVLILGIVVLISSVLVTAGVIKIKDDTINPYVAKTPLTTADVVWDFQEKVESDGLNPPGIGVTLRIKDKKYDAGVYEGSCSVQTTEMIINQVSRAICWWAGGGVELGVFVEDKKTVLKRRPVDEGTAEYPSFVSPFEIVLELM